MAVFLGKKGRGVSVDAQVGCGFVRQFAFSLFASGIQFTEVPRICLIFDHAFIECALDRGCLPVFGLKYSDPQNLIDNSIARTTGTLRA